MALNAFRTKDYIWYECSKSDGKHLIKQLLRWEYFFAISYPLNKPKNMIVIVSAYRFRDENHITSLINDYKWDNMIDS